LQAALVSILQTIPQFGGRVGEQWSEPQAHDLPCARVGVTDSAEIGQQEFVATIHITQRSDTREIINIVRNALSEAPLIDGRPFAAWKLIFAEIRPYKKAAGYRALLRYQAIGGR